MNPRKERKRLLRKRKARWRRRAAEKEYAGMYLQRAAAEDGLLTRRGRSAIRGLQRRGATIEEIHPTLWGEKIRAVGKRLS